MLNPANLNVRWRIRNPLHWRAWLNEQHQDHGQQGGTGKYAEDAGEGHMAVTHQAEAPIGHAPGADAHQIHQTIAGAPQVGPGDLAEDRHVIGIKEAPAQAEEDEKRNCDPELSGLVRKTDPEHGGDD